jgi:hypothetical protein
VDDAAIGDGDLGGPALEPCPAESQSARRATAAATMSTERPAEDLAADDPRTSAPTRSEYAGQVADP